jgi:hypothetical protein
MAVQNFTSAQKPHLYNLMSNLNESFARLYRKLTLLEETGVFQPRSLKPFLQQISELQAQTNSHLLATFQSVEQRHASGNGIHVVRKKKK